MEFMALFVYSSRKKDGGFWLQFCEIHVRSSVF